LPLPKKLKCFVIMPFSGTTIRHTTKYWTEFYEELLKPLIEANSDVHAYRSEALRGDILSQIITDLVYSDIVVADLTDANPNVYWELGVRQSFSHRTITIIESGHELPFDLGIKGTLRYDTKRPESMTTFKSKFSEALKDCIANPTRPDSHVIQTITGRGTIYEIIHHDETERRLQAVLNELATNQNKFTGIVKRVRSNQKLSNPTHWSFVTSRFIVSAIELLVTNRYHEASETFYEKAEYTYSAILAWNEQLPIWQLRPERTQQWMIRQVERKEWPLNDVISDFQKLADAELRALQSRL